MAFDFPASPTNGQIFTPPGGPTYVWNGSAWAGAGFTPVVTVLPTAEARNRVVNGAMQISQENGSAAVTNGYAADQWVGTTSLPTATFTRSGGPSASGGKQLAATIATAKPSLAAGDYWQLTQYIEGSRVADFRWGAVEAKRVVLRFWAYTDNPGTYTVSLSNWPSTQWYLAPFTLAANTWTEIVVVIPGATAGVWATDTNIGLVLNFGFAAGATYAGGVAGWGTTNKIQIAGNTNGAALANKTFFIADVGLYLDPNNTGIAPPWQMPDEAQEMLACMRYWQKYRSMAVETPVNCSTYIFTVPQRIPPATSGGGAGFAVNWNDYNQMLCSQTARALLDIVLNARM
jgi:hypothetical protein